MCVCVRACVRTCGVCYDIQVVVSPYRLFVALVLGRDKEETLCRVHSHHEGSGFTVLVKIICCTVSVHPVGN